MKSKITELSPCVVDLCNKRGEEIEDLKKRIKDLETDLKQMTTYAKQKADWEQYWEKQANQYKDFWLNSNQNYTERLNKNIELVDGILKAVKDFA